MGFQQEGSLDLPGNWCVGDLEAIQLDRGALQVQLGLQEEGEEVLTHILI
jgi:hypothetical protein